MDFQIAKLFTNGQSQAVRLPKDFRFEGKEVYIRRVGDVKWSSISVHFNRLI